MPLVQVGREARQILTGCAHVSVSINDAFALLTIMTERSNKRLA